MVEGHEQVEDVKERLDRKLRRSNSDLKVAVDSIKVRILTNRHLPCYSPAGGFACVQ